MLPLTADLAATWVQLISHIATEQAKSKFGRRARSFVCKICEEE